MVATRKKQLHSHYDKEVVRAAAVHRWPEILEHVGRLDSAIFDGKGHPCPKCGVGDDRFSFFHRDNSGGVLCRICFYDKSVGNNGDGFSAIGWMLDIGFDAAVTRVAEYIGGITPSTNGNDRSSSRNGSSSRKQSAKSNNAKPAKEKLEFKPLPWRPGFATLAGLWCHFWKPGVTVAAMRACGCEYGSYGYEYFANGDRCSRSVFGFPIYQPSSSGPPVIVGRTMYTLSGPGFPKFKKEPNGKWKQTGWDKTRNAEGSTKGFVGPIDKLPSAATIWLLEGISDMLAFESLPHPQEVIAVTGANGAGTALTPEQLTALKGKTVFVLFDRDDAGENGAPKRARQIAAHAKECRQVRLPYPKRGEGEDGPKDVRDWLAEGHTYSDLAARADAAEVVTSNPNANEPEPESPGDIKLIADEITLLSAFAQDVGGRLYRYADGVYKSKAEAFVKQEVKRICHKLEMTKQWTSKLANEVCEFIRVDARELWDQPPLDVVNVKNGLLNLSTGELKEHSPDHLSSIRLPVTFDPTAKCPALEKFVAETFPLDARALAWEIPAWLMVPDLSIQKAVLLVGEGANGKSRYLAAVQEFIGRHNTTGLSLHKLESDRFAAARLVGRLANICPDLPTEHLASTSVFKALVGGDTIMAEHKFHDSFEIRPFARLLFSANHLPHSNDGSHGFFRRWLVVPFDCTFGEAEQIDQATLDAMLSAPAELSGLLNKAIEGRRRLVGQKGFTQAQSLTRAAEDFRSTTDPLAVWLDQNTTEAPDILIAKRDLHIAYNDSARQAGRICMSSNAFGRAIKRLRPEAEEAQRTIGGKTVWAYLGIGLVDSLHSRDSRDYPLLVSRTGEKSVDVESGATEQVEDGSMSVEQDRAKRVNRVNDVTDAERAETDDFMAT